jgi:hypothetical protein
MKRTLSRIVVSLALALLAAVSLAAVGGCSDNSPKAYVNIADGEGKLVMAMVPVKLADADSDEKLTVNDVLVAAHDAGFEGGAAAGYGTATGDYGLYITKLWGVENGGSYGYTVNNVSAMSLTDPVKEGDIVTAYIWRDVYTYFDVSEASLKKGDKLTLTLTASGYDENWAPVTYALEGAEITVDGEPTGIRTDSDGKAVITLEKGRHTVSATHDKASIVPPVCAATVK